MSNGVHRWLVLICGCLFGVLCFFLTKSKSILPWDWAKIIPLVLPSVSLVIMKCLPYQSSDPMDPYLFSIGIAIGFITVMLCYSQQTSKWIEITGQRENGYPLRVVMSAQSTVSDAEKILSNEARGPVAIQNLTGEVIPSSDDALLSKFPDSAKEIDIFGVLRLDLFVVWRGSPENEQLTDYLPATSSSESKNGNTKFKKISTMLKRSTLSLFSTITESSLPVCGESILMDAIVEAPIGNGGMTISRIFNVSCKRGFAVAEVPQPSSSSNQKEIEDCRFVRMLSWNDEKNIGDLVVFEQAGRYCHIHRGWWLAWSSSLPKRSGVFYIEYPSQKPIAGAAGIAASSSNANANQDNDDSSVNNDDLPASNTLTHHPSDHGISGSFKRGPPVAKFQKPARVRFRSLKFPDWELGMVKTQESTGDHVLGIQRIIMEKTDTWIAPCDFEIRPIPKKKSVFKKLSS